MSQRFRFGFSALTCVDLNLTLKLLLSKGLDSALDNRVVRYLGNKIWTFHTGRIDPNFFLAKHIFIVGCGHSGTSVLLSRLANHSLVTAIPGESRFFQYDVLRRSLILRRWFSLWSPGLVLAEKTPVHVRFCSKIKKIFPQSKIIGISRSPLDVVASLYQRHDKSLTRGISRWNKDNQFLIDEIGSRRIDCFLKYEDFVINTEETLRKIQVACELEVENELSLGTDESHNWYAKGNFSSKENAPSSNLNKKRQIQIGKAIYDGRGSYRQILTPEQIEVVNSETLRVATTLGYAVCS